MIAGLALLTHSLRRTRVFMFAMVGLVAGVQVLFVLAAESLQQFSAFERIALLFPDFVRQLLGSSLITVMSFRGVACLGYFHVAIVAVLVGMAIAIATEPAVEVETRFLDFVLAHPVSRQWIVFRSMLLLMGCVAVVVTAMLLSTRAALHWLAAPEHSRAVFDVVPLLSLNLAAILICWGSIAMVPAALVHRRSVAVGIAGFLAAASYITDLVSQVWQPLRGVARLSPFHYYNALNLITGNADPGRDLLVLACIAGVCFILASLLFCRRDL